MHLTALVHRVRRMPLPRRAAARMFVADDVLHAVQAARLQIAKDGTPAQRAFGVAEPAAEILAVAIGANADHPQGGGGQHLTFASDTRIVRVDDQVRHRLRIEPARPPRRQRDIQAFHGAADARRAHRLAAERLDHLADFARRDALQMILGQERDPRLLVPCVALEHGGLV